MVRWKERFEGLEKDRQVKVREVEDEKNAIINEFEEYKLIHNDGTVIEANG